MGFPPKVQIVLAFIDPPDVLGAVGRLAHEVPPGIGEGTPSLHLGGRLARAGCTCQTPMGPLARMDPTCTATGLGCRG